VLGATDGAGAGNGHADGAPSPPSVGIEPATSPN
jgi:hypothetical protein